ncbi:GtrA family protein [Oceanicoccus sp. KOV_DT_Chl]|uniref:GtrA family protein n=1 Tax=Oceanicoccus sp. KOV_DT_Chl TaxID=1904639 RepID=UPI000C7DAE8C|nr:GtrA family protein [Oceanicoccus sp. KOV_DT_Chl]
MIYSWEEVLVSGVRFFISGALNTVITYIFYLFLIIFMPYQLSYTITFAVGIVIGYFLNAIYVFRSKPGMKTATVYPMVYLVQYCLGMLFLYVMVDIFEADERFAPLVVIFLTVPIMFFINRMVFNGRKS